MAEVKCFWKLNKLPSEINDISDDPTFNRGKFYDFIIDFVHKIQDTSEKTHEIQKHIKKLQRLAKDLTYKRIMGI